MAAANILVLNKILEQQSGSATQEFVNQMEVIFQEEYTLDNIFLFMEDSIGLMFLLPLMVIYLRQTSSMMKEKETKIRETMSIMGMNLPLYYFTWFVRWFLTYFLVHLIGSIIITLAFPHISFLLAFFVFILFDLVLIVQSFFIQIFFTQTKLGVIMATLFFLIQFVISFALNSDSVTLTQNTFASIVPHVAFILAWQNMFYAESVQIDATLE